MTEDSPVGSLTAGKPTEEQLTLLKDDNVEDDEIEKTKEKETVDPVINETKELKKETEIVDVSTCIYVHICVCYLFLHVIQEEFCFSYRMSAFPAGDPRICCTTQDIIKRDNVALKNVLCPFGAAL